MKLAQFDFQISRICEQTGMSLADAYKTVKNMGYDYIVCENHSLDVIMDAVRNADLKIAQVYAFLNLNAPDLDDVCAKLIENAKACGATCIMPIPDDDRGDLLEKAYDTLRKITNEAKKAGIDTVLEDFGGANRTFATADGLMAYMENVPGLGCCFDTGNFFRNKTSLLLLQDRFIPYIKFYHLKDRSASEAFSKYQITHVRDGKQYGSAPVTLGDLPIETVVRQAIASGYDGVYALEHVTYNEQVSMQRSLDSIARIFQ